MRIALVTPYYPAHGGGVERVAGDIAAGLATTHGAHVMWFASDTDLPPDPGARLGFIPMQASNFVERSIGLPFPLWSPKSLKHLSDGIADADAVHVHDFAYPSSLMAVRFAMHHKRPILLTQHTGRVQTGNWLTQQFYNWAFATVGVRTMKLAASVVFVSAGARRQFEIITGPQHRYSTVWNGVDTDFVNSFRFGSGSTEISGLAFPLSKPFVLFVGRRLRKKGILIIREMATRMRDVTFVIAGSGPEDPATWMLENVHSIGQRSAPELAALYHAAGVVALPSYSEGFPLVVQEALACGGSVLSTQEVAEACPGVASLIRSCATPITDDPTPWINACRDMLGNPASDDVRGLRSQTAKKLFSWVTCCAEYNQRFRSVLGSRVGDSTNARAPDD